LVGPIGAGFFRNETRRFDHVAGELSGHAAAPARNDLQFGPEKAHVVELFARKGV